MAFTFGPPPEDDELTAEIRAVMNEIGQTIVGKDIRLVLTALAHLLASGILDFARVREVSCIGYCYRYADAVSETVKQTIEANWAGPVTQIRDAVGEPEGRC